MPLSQLGDSVTKHSGEESLIEATGLAARPCRHTPPSIWAMPSHEVRGHELVGVVDLARIPADQADVLNEAAAQLSGQLLRDLAVRSEHGLLGSLPLV